MCRSRKKQPHGEDGENKAGEVCGEGYGKGVASIFDAHGAKINS